MTNRYFGLAIGNRHPSPIRVNINLQQDKRVIDLTETYSFVYLGTSRKGAIYQIFRNDEYIPRETIPILIEKASQRSLGEILLSPKGISSVGKSKKIKIDEITKGKAEGIVEYANNWRALQAWV